MAETHVCGDCGLSVQKMHRYHRDCIAALRTELAEAQGRLQETAAWAAYLETLREAEGNAPGAPYECAERPRAVKEILERQLAEAQQQRDALQRAVQRVEGWLDIHVSSLTDGEEASLRDAIALPARAAEPDGLREALREIQALGEASDFDSATVIAMYELARRALGVADRQARCNCLYVTQDSKTMPRYHSLDPSCPVHGVAGRRPYDPPSVCARCGAEHFVGQSHKCVADSPPEEHAG